jgi:chemotaxis-related protein WspD
MVHRLPHYDTNILRGIVNIHGQLRLCFSMAELLGIEEARLEADGKHRVFPRMMVIRRNERRFAMLVDEVLSSSRYSQEDILPVPTSLSRALVKFVRGILQEGERSIGLLNEEIMFQAMDKSLK